MLCTLYRYEKRTEYVDNLQLVSWWEFYSNENTLSEWDDDDVQFYDEENDDFGLLYFLCQWFYFE